MTPKTPATSAAEFVAGRTWIKICGITEVEDAECVVCAGADLLGLNFVPASKRRISVELARQIRRHLGGRIQVIGVVADLTLPELADLRARTGVDALQLHGDEPAELLEQLPQDDYKAVRIGAPQDVAKARVFRGPKLLVDAKVGGELGGTGHCFDWSLLEDLPGTRRLLLAGGLHPDNVGSAIRAVRPWAVDVASGVERQVARKDPELVRRFVAAVRAAQAVTPSP